MLEKDLLNSIENPDRPLAIDAQNGVDEAEEALIRKYSGIVYNKARAYFMVGAGLEDVVQEGLIGLLKAVRKYDPDKNVSFGAFAETCVTNQIISAIRSADRIKHKPLNTSVSFSKPLGADGGGQADEGEITLGDTISANPADSPDQMVSIKDVAFYILNNGDNIFSKFEMEVLNELVKGYSSDQIATKLGKGQKSVDNAIQRCKIKVNEYLWK